MADYENVARSSQPLTLFDVAKKKKLGLDEAINEFVDNIIYPAWREIRSWSKSCSICKEFLNHIDEHYEKDDEILIF